MSGFIVGEAATGVGAYAAKTVGPDVGAVAMVESSIMAAAVADVQEEKTPVVAIVEEVCVITLLLDVEVIVFDEFGAAWLRYMKNSLIVEFQKQNHG